MPRAVLDAIVAHARADAPLECCGLLIGSANRIDDCYPVDNVRRSPVAFEVDPAGHFAAIRKARGAGRAVIGAYHSHPHSPAVPSPTDIREANDPEFVHLIVSLAGERADVQAFRITAAGAVNLRLEIG